MGKLLEVVLCSLVLPIGCWAQSPGSNRQEQSEDHLQQPRQDVTSDDKQLAPQSPLHLTTVETVLAKREIAIGFADLLCDEDGNIYLGSENAGGPIRKLNAKGELVAPFELNAGPDVEVYGNGPYALNADGDLYTWVGNNKDGYYYMLVFGSDGKYKRKIKLDPGFPWVPGPFAVFSNGNLLMTGQEYDRDVRRPMLPFTAIFRSDGRLLKELSLEDDGRIHNLAKQRDPKLTSAAVPDSNRAVAWGRVKPARDGNIYVMRWLSPAVIYVVSPGGDILRRFIVDPGAAALMPVEMHVAGNRIAILFRDEGTKEQQMKIVDPNGEEIATYGASGGDAKAPLGAAFACYFGKTGRFSFLATDEDHRVLLRIVEPR